MSNTNGVAYRDKSLNGIITLSDGDGTTISNGTITTDTISTTNFITSNLNVNNIQGKLQSDSITLYTSTTTGSILIGTGIDPATTIKIGNQNCDLQLAGMSITNQNFEPSDITASMTVGSDLSTGQLTLGSTLNTNKIGGLLINNQSVQPSNTTASMNVGSTLSSGQLTLGSTSNNNKIGGFTINNTTMTAPLISSVVNLFNNLTTGTLTIADSIVLGTVNIAVNSGANITIGNNTSNINVGGFNLTGNSILTPATNATANLFTTLTNGVLNVGGATGIRLNGNIRKLYTTLTTPVSSEIGYIQTGTGSTSAFLGFTNITLFRTLVLGVGVWNVLGQVQQSSGTIVWLRVSISTSTTALDSNAQSSVWYPSAAASTNSLQVSRFITNTSATTYYLVGQASDGVNATGIVFQALRIA